MAAITLTGHVIGIIVATLFIAVSSEKTVQCYLCNHSPKDNRTDEWCTSDNFRPEMAQIIDCPRGCEQVTQKDLNDELEHFHRNCYRSNETLEETCRDVGPKSYKRRMCVCTTNLCNAAVTLGSSMYPMLVIIFVFLTTSWWTTLIR